MTKNLPNKPTGKWLQWLTEFFNKKRSVQNKIDDLAVQIYHLEQSNDDYTQGSALSKRQHKRIAHDRWVNDVTSKYDHMVKRNN